MASTEKFCLRWNDFENNISSAFRELRDDKDFFDITLACEDDQIQAHKVILSACSPFFRTVLRRNPHQHPILYLKGISYLDLQSVLNFMYHGEVNVAQEELNTFLAVAEDLKVKGLTQNNTNESRKSSGGRCLEEQPKSIKAASRSNDRNFSRSPKPTVTTPSQAFFSTPTDNYEDIQEVVPVKTEPKEMHVPTQPMPQSSPVVPTSKNVYNPHPTQALATTDDQLVYQEENYEDYSHHYEMGQEYEGDIGSEGITKGVDYLDALIAAKMAKTSDALTNKSVWQCLECGKEYKLKGDASRHVEAHHIDHPGFSCDVCGKIYKTRDSLRNHFHQLHSIKNRNK